MFMLFVFVFFWVLIGSVWVWGKDGLPCVPAALSSLAVAKFSRMPGWHCLI